MELLAYGILFAVSWVLGGIWSAAAVALFLPVTLVVGALWALVFGASVRAMSGQKDPLRRMTAAVDFMDRHPGLSRAFELCEGLAAVVLLLVFIPKARPLFVWLAYGPWSAKAFLLPAFGSGRGTGQADMPGRDSPSGRH